MKTILCSLTLALPLLMPCFASAQEASAPVRESVHYPALTNEVLGNLISAEIATQRGHSKEAFDILLEQAVQTQDPRISRRAFDVALASGNPSDIDKALKTWKQYDEDSLAQAFEDVRQGRLDAALPPMRKAMENDDQPVRLFNQIFSCLSGVKIVDALPFLEKLAEPQLKKNASFSIVLCRLASRANSRNKAVKYARSAIDVAPDKASVVQKAASALMTSSPDAAQQILEEFLKENPDHVGVRLVHARTLLIQKKTQDARKDLGLLPSSGLSAPQWYQSGELWQHMRELSKARDAFLNSLNAPGQTSELRDRCYARLGILSEMSKHPDDAVAWYEKIQSGQRYVPAKLRSAEILLTTGRPDRAISVLSQAKPSDEAGKIKIATVLSGLLEHSSQPWQAYEVRQQVAEEVKDAPFLYETALLAEKVGDLSAMESYLRKAIEADSSYAQALNALGYTLADQGRQLDEALQLIARANELAPSDPYVLDSLGWVHYRLGNNDLAIRYLKESLSIKYMQDTAAHLVEVLMHAGKQDEAKDLLEKYSAKDPADGPLKALREQLRHP